MFAVISLLAILSLSMLVVRIGAVALMMTGLSRDAAAWVGGRFDERAVAPPAPRPADR